jgi:hypothetical protein
LIRRTALLLGVLLVVTCSSGADQPSVTGAPATTTTLPPSTTTTGPSEESVEAFRDCMGDNGVEIEEIPRDATGRPRLDLVMASLDFADAVVAAAIAECSKLLETGALDLSGDDELHDAVMDKLAEFSRCMVDMGIDDFPDPVPGYLGVGSPFPVAEIPYTAPGFADAVVVCRAALLEALSQT